MHRLAVAIACLALAACSDSHAERCASSAECEAGQSCVDGMCVATPDCDPPRAVCGSSCVDVRTDVSNCGSCGSACPSGEVCLSGSCAASCGGDLSECGGGCVDTRFDPGHCGTCDNTCSFANATSACVDAACSLASCEAGFDDCDADTDNGCETDLAAATDCGACGNDCGIGPCVDGACVPIASCSDVLAAGLSTGDGVYTIDLGGDELSVYCDMTTRDGGWTLLTNHEGAAGFFGDAAGGRETAVDDPTAPLYSILGRVDAFAREGTWELFYWNRQFDEQIVSTQTSSPLDDTLVGACAADWMVVDASYAPGLFCGYTPGPAAWSTINGNGPNWTHAVGQFVDYRGWPLVCTHDSGYQCNHIQLYVR